MKTDLSDTRAAETAQKIPEGASAPPTPRTAYDIPGIGPIRARAIIKAGYRSLAALQRATTEELCAIPGVSSIKAEHIHSYLAQFPNLPETEATDPVPKSATGAIGGGISLEVYTALAESAQSLAEATQLLTDPRFLEFRPRLQRAVQQFARTAAAEVINLGARPEPERARLARHLRQAAAALTHGVLQRNFDRKAQGLLADRMQDIVQGFGSL